MKTFGLIQTGIFCITIGGNLSVIVVDERIKCVCVDSRDNSENQRNKFI